MFGLVLWLNRGQEHASPLVRRAIYGYLFFVNLTLLGGTLVFVNLLTYTYAREPFDWTKQSVYTLSEQTVNVLRNLKRPVKIIVLYDSMHPAQFTIRELLDLYRKYTGKIKVENVDPFRDFQKRKDLESRYPDLVVPGLVVEYGEGDETDHMVLKDSDLFSIDWRLARAALAEQVENEFKGEDGITTAIARLVEGKRKVKIYFTVGYGQLDLNDNDERSDRGVGLARQRLEDLKWEVAELDLSKEKKVPDDATVVILAGPKQRLPEAWVQAIRDYMDGGGRLIVLADFAYDPIRKSMARIGLEQMLSDYEVELSESRVLERKLVAAGFLLSTAVSMQVTAEPTGTHPIAEGLGGVRLELYQARPVRPKTAAPEQKPGVRNFQAVTILKTAGDAWAEADLIGSSIRRGDEGDEEGPIPVAVAVTELGEPTSQPLPGQPPRRKEEPRLVVMGDADFISNIAYDRAADALFLNCVNWLRGRLDMLGIPPKEKTRAVLKQDVNAWGLVWKPAVLMLAFFICSGISVWVVRHHF